MLARLGSIAVPCYKNKRVKIEAPQNIISKNMSVALSMSIRFRLNNLVKCIPRHWSNVNGRLIHTNRYQNIEFNYYSTY